MDCVGYVDVVSRFYVAGWVADRDDWSRSLKVDILVNGKGRGVCIADQFRDKLDTLHPNSTGRYAFKFYFAVPLSLYHEHDISVRVSKSPYYLVQGHPPIMPIEGNGNVPAPRPNGPILLTTMRRTGSTAIMAVLAQHPNIVVAGERPYEVELGCYYAYALRTLVAEGDHARSLSTDAITASENRFHLGFNPYFEASFSRVFKDPLTLRRYLTTRVPGRVGAAFREIILDYYEELARDQAVDHPIYFAEKSLPERDARLGIRFMFPNTREIVLIRDPRDVICSSMRSNGSRFDSLLGSAVSAGERILEIRSEQRPAVLFLRYEDFILDRARTISSLFEFLGLRMIETDEERMRTLFDAHATSANPQASIGRWKCDLTQDQTEKCGVLMPFLDTFGYASSST
jgi:hypothetical protein